MPLISCYDLDGVEHKKEGVDARECCAVMGWTLHPKGEESPAVKVPEAPKVDPEIYKNEVRLDQNLKSNKRGK